MVNLDFISCVFAAVMSVVMLVLVIIFLIKVKRNSKVCEGYVVGRVIAIKKEAGAKSFLYYPVIRYKVGTKVKDRLMWIGYSEDELSYCVGSGVLVAVGGKCLNITPDEKAFAVKMLKYAAIVAVVQVIIWVCIGLFYLL